MKIGILAIQGAVIEHRRALERLNVRVTDVRLPEDLEGIDGIIIPGGESTTISKLMKRFGLFDELKKRIAAGLPVWGTCAGAILLAKKVTGKNPPPTLEVMDILADRNAYGSQKESFEVPLDMGPPRPVIKDGHHSLQGKIQGIFIRAPKLDKLPDSDVEVLAKCDGEPVMLRQGSKLVTSFHPELTEDLRVHEYFVGMTAKI